MYFLMIPIDQLGFNTFDNSRDILTTFRSRLSWYAFEVPVGIYVFKTSNGNTRKMQEIYSKLTIKTPEGRQE